MRTFVDVLHVLSAVLLVGPLMVAPFVGRKAIQRRSADGVRTAASQMNVYGFGSLLTAALGVLLVLLTEDLDLGRPWIVISMTLYVAALCLVFFFAAPALRKAARMVEQGVLTRPEMSEDQDAATTQLTTNAADLQLKEQLDSITGRVGLAGLLVLLVFAVITVLMTVFGH